MVQMPSNYNQIMADNLKEYGEGTRHLSFLGRLYTDRTHFIFELLQNAEDTNGSRILFQLWNDRLEVWHNGRLFDEKDVRGVCGVGEGTKSEDLTQIGKFGIGFKSVYAYSSSPEVHSGDEHFKIIHYVRPQGVAPKEIRDPWTTLFVFPFDANNVTAEIANSEIAARLRNLSARTLLFLRKIQEIEFKLPDQTGGVYLREESKRQTARQVTVLGQNKDLEENERWLIFERIVMVPDGSTSVPVEVGFQLETDNKTKAEKISRVKNSPLIVYFPTEKETRFGFLIQGPYRTTPSRDNIPKSDEWNGKLVAETARLLIDSLECLKTMDLISVSLLESLPIRINDFQEDGMFFPIVTMVKDTLKSHELLPSDDGTFVAASNAILARPAELRQLLNYEQLRSLFKVDYPIKWLVGEITENQNRDLWTYLVKELDVKEYTPDVFARMVNEQFFAVQADEWFVDFYKFLLDDRQALWRAPRWSTDPSGILRTKPILRLQDGKNVVPFKSDGTTPQAFLPPPENTDFPIVKREILKDTQAEDFLKRLGLSTPDVYDDIIERVFPKYLKEESQTISAEEHNGDFQKFIRAINSDSDAGKRRVINTAKQTPFIRSVDQKGGFSFKKPSDVYFDNADLRNYFGEIVERWFVAETVTKQNLDILKDIDVAILPRILQTDKKGHSDVSREYSKYRDEYVNYELDGLDNIIDRLQRIDSPEAQKNLAVLLWHLLNNLLPDNKGLCNGRYKWFYRRWQEKIIESSFITFLREAEWILTKDGSIRKPTDVTVNELSEELLYSEYLIELFSIRDVGDVDDTDEKARAAEKSHAEALGISPEDAAVVREHRKEYDEWKKSLTSKEAKPVFPTRPVLVPIQLRFLVF